MSQAGSGRGGGADVERVSVEEARQRARDGAVLVCAYEDEDKCRRMRLEGALTLTELERRAPQLARDQELIFYCG
jgi:hypothetical protein